MWTCEAISIITPVSTSAAASSARPPPTRVLTSSGSTSGGGGDGSPLLLPDAPQGPLAHHAFLAISERRQFKSPAIWHSGLRQAQSPRQTTGPGLGPARPRGGYDRPTLSPTAARLAGQCVASIPGTWGRRTLGAASASALRWDRPASCRARTASTIRALSWALATLQVHWAGVECLSRLRAKAVVGTGVPSFSSIPWVYDVGLEYHARSPAILSLGSRVCAGRTTPGVAIL